MGPIGSVALVRLWPFSDIPWRADHVRSPKQSGHSGFPDL